jgi:hypothetical protein
MLELKADEQIQWQEKAAISLPRAAVKGTLYLTSARIVHVPRRFSRSQHSELREWPVGEIRSIDGPDSRESTIYRDLSPYAGAQGRRLYVRLKDGKALLFLLARRDEALAQLRAVLASAGQVQ